MTDLDANIDEIARTVVTFSQTAGFDIPGPADIEYGYGWEPTISFWHGRRRIHFYWHWHSNEDREDDKLTVEVSYLETGKRLTGKVRTYEELLAVFEKVFKERCELEMLPDCEWRRGGGNHDNHIPHPPDAAGIAYGNIAAFVELAEAHGQRWQPASEKGRGFRLLDWFNRLLRQHQKHKGKPRG